MNAQAVVARALWSFSRVDGDAVSIMRYLGRNPLFTDQERQEMLERLAPEETHHSEVSAMWARRLGMLRPPTDNAYSAYTSRDSMVMSHIANPCLQAAWTLATTRWSEEVSVSSFPRWIKLWRDLGWHTMAQDYAVLTDEERRHVEFGIRTANRLSDDPAFRGAYRHYYRLTAHAGVAVLSSTYAGTLRELEAFARTHEPDPYPEHEWRGAPHAHRDLDGGR